MPPSTIIDASLAPWSNDVYFVIEAQAIWKTENLTAVGAADWTQVYDGSSFAEGDLEFKHIKATVTQNLIYATGVVDVGGGSYKAYFFRSSTNGATWSYHEITGAGDFTGDPFTVTTEMVQIDKPGAGRQNGYTTHERLGDDESPTYNPFAIAVDWTRTGDIDVGYDFRAAVSMPAPETAYINQFQTSGVAPPAMPLVHRESSLSAGELTALETFLSTFFGGVEDTGWTYDINGESRNFDTDDERVRVGHTCGDGTGSAFITDYVFWGKTATSGVPFDYARTNVQWIYVGADDKILKSENGGFDWTVLYDAHGAYDLCVDPQAAGALYYWSSEGNLELLVAGIPQTTLLSDSPLRQHGRIARQLNGGMLWVITADGTLKRRNLGAWADQDTGISNGKGLITYTGGTIARVLYVSDDDIWYSDNAGEGWAGKKGAWGWGSPVNVFLMRETA